MNVSGELGSVLLEPADGVVHVLALRQTLADQLDAVEILRMKGKNGFLGDELPMWDQ